MTQKLSFPNWDNLSNQQKSLIEDWINLSIKFREASKKISESFEDSPTRGESNGGDISNFAAGVELFDSQSNLGSTNTLDLKEYLNELRNITIAAACEICCGGLTGDAKVECLKKCENKGGICS